MDTLTDLITTAAERYGPCVALTLVRERSSECWTYADLYRYARRVAQMVQARGIAPGERVVIWAPNGPRWVGAFFGCVLAGVVVVPLDVKSTAAFVGKIAAQSEPRLAVATRATAAGLAALGLPCVAVEDLDAALPEDDTSWCPVQVRPDDVAELVFTSGTTGAPKGVMLSHENILSDLQAVYTYLPPSQTYRMLSLLPLSHMFEQIAELFYILSVGASIIYVDSLQPATIFRAMRDERVTAIPVVPQILALFMSGIERDVKKAGKWRSWERAHRLASLLPLRARRLLFRAVHARLGGRLDFVVSGGAHLDPRLAQRWENLGIKVVIGYGATEASPIITANSFKRRNLHSVGRPIPCNEVRIAADGEILVRGRNITRGYWRNEEATRAAFDDGWYRTGDLGHFDTAGYLYLKGRKKNMIVLANGMNVYPEDVENALLEEPGMTDAVVLGREHEGDVALHAVLLLQPGADAEAIVKRANKRLAPHQRVKSHTVWPEKDLPRTLKREPKRDEIVRLLAAREAAGTPRIRSGV
jgi:long-chain acyl-CoA synthetase